MKLHRDAKAQLIRSVPLFAECSASEVDQVASIADEIDLREGRVLASEGAPGREFVVIVDGTAEVRKGDELIATVGPGQFIGEIALVTGQPRNASVVATSSVHALVIEGHAFQQLLKEAPDISAKVERAVRDRLDRDADPAGA